MVSREAILHQQVCDYLRLQYPTVMFRTDFAAGIKMTPGQAIRHKRLQSGRAWPDLFIAEPSLIEERPFLHEMYFGLFLELKATGTILYNKDGSLRSNKHLLEQEKVLQDLRDKGYKAEFAVGFDEAVNIIDHYLWSLRHVK